MKCFHCKRNFWIWDLTIRLQVFRDSTKYWHDRLFSVDTIMETIRRPRFFCRECSYLKKNQETVYRHFV